MDTSHFTGSAWNQGERYTSFCRTVPLDDILVEDSQLIGALTDWEEN